MADYFDKLWNVGDIRKVDLTSVLTKDEYIEYLLTLRFAIDNGMEQYIKALSDFIKCELNDN